MAPRPFVRRSLAVAPAVAATALVLAACSPPNEQPADPDADYTLPTYVEPEGSENGAEDDEAEGENGGDGGATTTVTTTVSPDEQNNEGEGGGTDEG